MRSGESGGCGMERERPRSVSVITGLGCCCQFVILGRSERGRLRRTSRWEKYV